MKACQQTRRTIERFFFFSLNYDDADDRNQESDGVMISLEKFAYIHTVPSKYHVSCIHPAHPFVVLLHLLPTVPHTFHQMKT